MFKNLMKKGQGMIEGVIMLTIFIIVVASVLRVALTPLDV